MMMRNKMKLFFSDRCIMKALFIVHCSLFIHITAGAQTFTQRIQKTVAGEGKVTIHQDKAIDNLVNGTAATTTVAQPKQGASQTEKKQPATRKTNNRETTPSTPAAQPAASASSTTDTTTPGIDTTDVAKTAVRTYKVMGYRVQAFAGGNSRKDRQKAEQTGNQLRALFPNEQVYTHFYSPRWICRIGNFRTYEEAHQMLQEVKSLGYSSATIVKGKISVPY